MTELNRTKVGKFDICDTVTIEELEKNCNNLEFMNKYFISIEKLFENNEKIDLDANKLRLFLNGVRLTVKIEEGIYKIYSDNKFIGIGTVKDNLLKRDIIVLN